MRDRRREATAETESSSPTLHAVKKPAADAELLTPFLQEALRPLLETYTVGALAPREKQSGPAGRAMFAKQTPR